MNNKENMNIQEYIKYLRNLRLKIVNGRMVKDTMIIDKEMYERIFQEWLNSVDKLQLCDLRTTLLKSKTIKTIKSKKKIVIQREYEKTNIVSKPKNFDTALNDICNLQITVSNGKVKKIGR